MANKSLTSCIAIILLVSQLGVLSVSAATGCAAEANFQGCKTIQETLLHGCGPVDYSCQCNAQKLIQQCYNLCPEYAIDANEQARVAAAICVAVPSTSVALAPSSAAMTPASSTWMAPTATGYISAPSVSQSMSKSFANTINPMFGLIFATSLVGFASQLL